MSEFQSQHNVVTHFDNSAHVYYSWYTMLNSDGHSFRIRRTRCLELLQSLKTGAKIADIGCGPATFIDELLKAGFNVLATDIAPHMIEDGRARFIGQDKIHFEVSPAHKIPVPNASLSAITAMGLLEYLNEEDAVYTEMHRALEIGGRAIITYPHIWSPTRLWAKYTYIFLKPFVKMARKILNKKIPNEGVKHREYNLKHTIQQFEKAGFTVTDIVFYNFKLGFRPLDTLFPRATVWISERLEKFCRTPILRRIGTGFILLGMKR